MKKVKILDACCGSKMFYFQPESEIVLFMDNRQVVNEKIWESKDGLATRYVTVHPDLIADFRKMPFDNESFYMVVFDPPHLVKLGDTSWTAKKYGKLPKDWEPYIRDGFSECWRVLKKNGTLIFKWNERDIPVNDIIKCIGKTPLFGTRSGKQAKTIWMAFFKED